MAEHFVNLINLLFASHCNLDPRSSYQADYSPFLKTGDIFDFIVVGGGSAGAVIASRLSEIPSWSVLLLEAGDYPTFVTETPALSTNILRTEQDWNYKTQQQESSCRSYIDGICTLPRGKILGGTGSMNGMTYVRSPKENYDDWAELGNVGWGWNEVRKYFRKVERAINITNSDYGTDGPIAVTYYQSRSIIRDLLLNSAREAGLNVGKDEQNLGLFEYMVNVENGTRSGSAKGYIASSKARKNLFLALKAHVTKIVIKNQQAVGVEVSIGGKIIKLFSSKEVIISAGAISSPQLLMLSGIGPKEHLKQLGIKVIKNAQVGKNYQDHIGLRGVFFTIKLQDGHPNEDIYTSALDYCINRKGLYSGDLNLNLMYSFNTSNPSQADTHVQMTYIQKNNTIGVLNQFDNADLVKKIADTINELGSKNDLINFAPFLAQPRFRGEILLKSKDPFQHPFIFTNLLTNEDDVNDLIAGIHSLKRLLDTKAMKEVQAELVDLKIDECTYFEFDTFDYWKCFIHNMAFNYFHSVGTCKMGPLTDPNAIVCPKFQVFGIENLRVIDASVMPRIVSRNTNAPTVMMAERGADIIKQKYLNLTI